MTYKETYPELNFNNMVVEPCPSWLNLNTKITSDTHFFHANIGIYCQRPENWQEELVQYWQTVITDQDVIFHLGDVAFGSIEKQLSLLPFLPGQKHLLLGNHDRTRPEFWESAGFADIIRMNYVVYKIEDKYVIFSHYPVDLIEWPDDMPVINIHGHVHNSPYIYQDNPTYFNVGVDVTDFKFVELGKILKK